jgi:endonuclease/exonuclease/phosphatase family metal-dependent hydrolase
MKKTFIFLFFLILVILAAFRWASDSTPGPGSITGMIYSSNADPVFQLLTPDTLRVMTWNIAYAHGMGSDGVDYQPRNKAEYEEQLQGMAKLIRDSHADIVLIQEIDFDASRSHRMNQLQILSALSGLKFSAEAVTWDAGFVPFPYWPLKNQFGRVRSGGAVLSRFPILENDITLHPKPDANPWYYNAFYLFRYSQSVSILAGERQFSVINNHLEAYDRENREQQAELISELINQTNSDVPVIVFGGDMNSLPGQASVQHNFDDGYDDDYREDQTMNVLNSISGFREVVHDSLYTIRESDFHTFPSSDATRRLDYIFVSDSLRVIDFNIINIEGLSDHFPVTATLVWD